MRRRIDIWRWREASGESEGEERRRVLEFSLDLLGFLSESFSS